MTTTWKSLVVALAGATSLTLASSAVVAADASPARESRATVGVHSSPRVKVGCITKKREKRVKPGMSRSKTYRRLDAKAYHLDPVQHDTANHQYTQDAYWRDCKQSGDYHRAMFRRSSKQATWTFYYWLF